MSRSTTVAYFTEYAKADGDQSEELVIPEDLAELSTEDLDELHTKAYDAFTALYGDGKDLSPEDVETLEGLTEGIEAIRAEQAVRAAAAEELAEKATGLADRLAPKAEAEEADPEEGVAEDAEAEDAEPEVEAVAASAHKEIRVPMNRVRSRRPVVEDTEDGERTIKDIAFSSTGEPVDKLDIAKLVDKRLNAFNLAAYKAAARGNRKMSERFPIATFQRQMEADLIVDRDNADEAIKRAVDESRLPGGALTASGGWCAPSETVYDLCDLSEAKDLISLPEIQINRGGLKFTLGPDYQSVFGDTGFCYTEAEDIAGDYDGAGGGTKPCIHVPCPDFEEERLGYCGICITAGLLQKKGYPEAIQNFIDIALNAHAHRVSASVINTLVSKSTAVALANNQAGSTAPLLTAIDLQATHYRAVNRMNSMATLEVVLPTWTMLVLRADLARRQGVDLIDVPEARVNAWLAARNVNAQYVVDWQDIATTPASGFIATPTSIKFLLYAAGTFVKGVTDSITLENIYDSVGLGTNDYTALFTEDPYLVAKRCQDSRVVTVPICADGSTHIGVEIACNGTTA